MRHQNSASRICCALSMTRPVASSDCQKARASIESKRAKIESERTKLEILRRSVPDSSGLDRLLRYEASLERTFDRALNQLERLQRMRRGQPVAPRIDVNVSG